MTEHAGIQVRLRVDKPGFTLSADLVLPSRGVTVLFGPSGSGKTTLLRCIAGLEPDTDGFLSVRGEVWQDGDNRRPPHRRDIGYVFQDAGLFQHLTVLGNLRYGRRRSTARPEVDLEQVIALLGIGHLLARKPDRLSGGEQSRVAIARALAVNPRVLLMDEPLAALDEARKLEILPYLERLHDELDIPVIYISHSPDEVARLADYLVLLEAGRVMAHGPLGEVLSRLDLPVRLGKETGVVLDAVIGERDADWHLVRADFPGGGLWTRDSGQPLGKAVRLRVLARDVSLARPPAGHSSIQNVLPAVVDALGEDEHPGLMLVRVRIGGSALIARLTRRAAAELAIAPGQEVLVQVKSVALME